MAHKVGFIGLGNVGGKLAGSLLRNKIDLTVRDLDKTVAQAFIDKGARWGESPEQMARDVDITHHLLAQPGCQRGRDGGRERRPGRTG